MTEILLTVPEVAGRLQVPDSWVYRHAPELGGFKVGKYWRFEWDEVMRRLRDGTVTLGHRTNDLPQAIDRSASKNDGERKGNGFRVRGRPGEGAGTVSRPAPDARRPPAVPWNESV